MTYDRISCSLLISALNYIYTYSNLLTQIFDSKGDTIEPVLKDNRDGTFSCKYVPKIVGKHTLQVNLGRNKIKKLL